MRRIYLFLGSLLLVGLLAVAPPACDGGGNGSDKDVGGGEEDGAGGGEADLEEPCQPACGDKECGDDGCGGSCGNCYTVEGALKNELCLPDGSCTVCGCGERKCGEDACGSPCGSCPLWHLCTEVGQCELDPAACQTQGFAGGDSVAKLKQGEDGFWFRFSSTLAQEGNNQLIFLEIDTRAGKGGPTGPGDYKAHFNDFNAGGLWLYGKLTHGANETWMAPAGGTISIETLAADGNQFRAVLKEVIFQEIKVDDGIVIPIPGGKLWCLDGTVLESAVLVTPSKCGDQPIGKKIGSTIANFQLQNCNGDWVDLYDSCGHSEALWIVATAGW